MLKRIGIGVGAATLLVVLVGFLMPRTYTVTRSLVIDAGPDRIQSHLVELEGRYVGPCAKSYADTEGGTRVTWVLEGDAGWNILDRYLNVMMDGLVGPRLEDDLDRLKVLSERPQETGDTP